MEVATPKTTCLKKLAMAYYSNGLLLFFIYIVHAKKKKIGTRIEPCTFGLKWDFNIVSHLFPLNYCIEKNLYHSLSILKKSKTFFQLPTTLQLC
jgi:hypothetical protein